MAIDRDATLKRAEKSLRAGRLDAAIADYAQLVDEHPREWGITNTLGDLYVRTGQVSRAIHLYERVVNHLLAEGFLQRAAAFLRKIIRIDPDDEVTMLRLGEISVELGLLAEARAYFGELERRRRLRGEEAAADELILRMETLEAAPPPPAPQPPPSLDAILPPLVESPGAVVAAGPVQRGSAAEEAPLDAPPAAPPDTGPDLEDIFAGIRTSLETSDPEGDPVEYLALAKGLIELGKVNEAVDALSTAARSPRYRFEAGVQIAQLLRDSGDIPAAIEWYERASGAPAPGEEEGRLLLYDLGDLLEIMGETRRALAVFIELAADAPGYRDVGERIARLSDGAVGG